MTPVYISAWQTDAGDRPLLVESIGLIIKLRVYPYRLLDSH